MLSLSTLLNNRTWYTLWTMAHKLGLAFNGRHTHLMASSRMHHHLLTEGHLKRGLNRLSSEKRQPLLALQAAGSRMPLTQFVAVFGAIRLYRPWRPDVPRQIWKQPQSIAEELWYLALIDIVGD